MNEIQRYINLPIAYYLINIDVLFTLGLKSVKGKVSLKCWYLGVQRWFLVK